MISNQGTLNKTSNMRKFNLKDALDGHEVVTLFGHTVVDITYDKFSNTINGCFIQYGEKFHYTWGADGLFPIYYLDRDRGAGKCNMDLYIKTEETFNKKINDHPHYASGVSTYLKDDMRHQNHDTIFSSLFTRICTTCNVDYTNYRENGRDYRNGKFNVLGYWGDNTPNESYAKPFLNSLLVNITINAKENNVLSDK